MGHLDDRLWRFAIELFLYAGRVGKNGYLGAVEEIAWSLRKEVAEIETLLKRLEKINIVEYSGGWKVTHFESRQSALSGKERQRKYTERGAQASRPNHVDQDQGNGLRLSAGESIEAGECDASVTKRHAVRDEKNTEEEVDIEEDIEEDIEAEEDEQKKSASAAAAINIAELREIARGMGSSARPVATTDYYKQNIGPVTTEIKKLIIGLEVDYAPGWVLAAMQEAVLSNGRSIKYVMAILQRWEKQGYKSKKNGQSQARTKQTEDELLEWVAEKETLKNGRDH
jgi:DnaD/phage-associated family protein